MRSAVVAVAVPLLAIVFRYALDLAIRKRYTVHMQGGVVITGAGSGIGRHAALSLASKGYTVYAACKTERDVDNLTTEGLKTLRPVQMDVTNQSSIDEAFKFIVSDLAHLELPLIGLVNNAGVARTYPVELTSIKTARETFEVNYFGVLAVTQKFLPLLRKTGNGARLVQISSVGGLISGPGGQPYGATKYALESMSDSLRYELDPWGVSVSVVNPGFVNTSILGKYSELRQDANEEHARLYNMVLNKVSGAPEAIMHDCCPPINLFLAFAVLVLQVKLAKEKKMLGAAPGPEVTTAVIEDAIMSPFPQVRYICADIGGVPPMLYVWLKWLLPERLMDSLVVMDMAIDASQAARDMPA
jgi:NAD(P)-dependent dehydrogenase (short-subunit alcohol dehydrogenase family)